MTDGMRAARAPLLGLLPPKCPLPHMSPICNDSTNRICIALLAYELMVPQREGKDIRL